MFSGGGRRAGGRVDGATGGAAVGEGTVQGSGAFLIDAFDLLAINVEGRVCGSAVAVWPWSWLQTDI